MKAFIAGVVIGCGLVAGCATDDVDAEETSAELGGPSQRYIVVFRAASAPADATTRIAKAGGRTSKLLGPVGVATAIGNATFAAKLAKDPGVLAVGPEHSYKLPTTKKQPYDGHEPPPPDEPPPPMVHTPDAGHFLQWDIRRVGAYAVWERGFGAQPRVAVLDTGVAHDHPDLQGQVCESRQFSYCGSTSYPSYDHLIDFTDPNLTGDPAIDCQPSNTTYQAHGTHVAGTIAAKFGAGDVIGVAPNACVAGYKVFEKIRFEDPNWGVVEDYTAFDGPLFDAIITAAHEGYPVINMSLGGSFDVRDGGATLKAWRRVTAYAAQRGTLIVAAAGNSLLDSNGTVTTIPSDLPAVMSVSATGSNNLVFGPNGFEAAPGSDVIAFYSNFGSAIDISAPGGDCGPQGFPASNDCWAEHLILSTVVLDNGDFWYDFYAGTSMASPHVAAVAAQVRALHPTWTPNAVRSWLKDTAQVIGPRQQFGAGMVNADLAVR